MMYAAHLNTKLVKYVIIVLLSISFYLMNYNHPSALFYSTYSMFFSRSSKSILQLDLKHLNTQIKR